MILNHSFDCYYIPIRLRLKDSMPPHRFIRNHAVAPETIMKIIDGYNKVQPNLLKHEPGYPTAQTLLAVVKQGLPLYGKEPVGKGKHSTGAWFFGCYASRYCLWAGRRHTIMADAYS